MPTLHILPTMMHLCARETLIANLEGLESVLPCTFVTHPKLFNGLNYEPKVTIAEGEGVGALSLACKTLRVEGHVGASGWD
jgi:hypothetical protein